MTQNSLPQGWVESSIGNIHFDASETVNPAKDPSRVFELWSVPSFASGEPEIIKGSEIGSHKQSIRPGTVLLSGINPRLNRVWLVEPRTGNVLIGSTEWIPFFRIQGLDPKYLAYFLQQYEVRDFLASRASGVGGSLMRVKAKTIANFPFPLAPEKEQPLIVAEIEKQLTRLDAAVVALKRVQANLKRYRAAVLKAACEGRLVPTEAELARKEGRSYETGEQLLVRILKERRARWEADQFAKMQASGKPPKNDEWKKKYKEHDPPDVARLPLLPKDWVWASLGQIADIQGGIQKQPSRAPRKNAYPFLRVANVYRGRLDLLEIHKIELFGDELSKLRLCAGDLLIVEGNGSPTEIGRMAIWKGEIENCVHQNHIIRARLMAGIRPEYCAAYWNSTMGSSEVARVAGSTSGLYTLSVGKLNRIVIPIPPSSEQDRIVEEMERVLTNVGEIEPTTAANHRRADRLRQSILKRAFEGKLVPQDPNDEPASALLARIRAERAKVGKPRNPIAGGRRRKKTNAAGAS